MQGWPRQIATAQKVEYLKTLMQVGFHTIDCVSFVSPKAIPQMADSHEVIKAVEAVQTHSRLLAIVANERGAEEACRYQHITDIGYPFSISPTFQQRNANSTIKESHERLKRIADEVHRHSKQMVVYISMAFGNPYGDTYNSDLVTEWIEHLSALNISVFSLADTVGIATAADVETLTKNVVSQFENLNIGVHLHSSPEQMAGKLQAALDAGCKRFDSAIGGFGGCPMAGSDLVGNINTLFMYQRLKASPYNTMLNEDALLKAMELAGEIFT